MQSCNSSGPLTVTDVRGPFFVLSWVMAAPGLGRAHPPPWLDVLHSHPYAPRGAFPSPSRVIRGGGVEGRCGAGMDSRCIKLSRRLWWPVCYGRPPPGAYVRR